MFTKSELELLYDALTFYWLHHHDEHERQKAKGRHKCGWHLPVMQKVSDLQSKIYHLKLSM